VHLRAIRKGITEPLDIAERLRWQAHWCGRLGSPLYEALLERAADDFTAGGPVAAVLADRGGNPPGSALGLRLMGATHRLVLLGRAPGLAASYPSTGGNSDADAAWRALRALLVERRDEVRALLDRPVQTNEVGRSGALVGGFLTVAAQAWLPLAVLELGASAGLNLRWDHYLYEARGLKWGDPESPVRLCDYDTPPVPPFGVAARVVERRGCDGAPIDPTTEEGRVTLMSYVWPDQLHRFRLLKSALEVARRIDAPVDEADAVEWTRIQLEQPRPGTATVVFHSVFWQYLSEPQQVELRQLIHDAGARAIAAAPLAWLSLEPGEGEFEVRLTQWPGGEEKLIAVAGPHGNPVRWLG
jgi:hypothetical protein